MDIPEREHQRSWGVRVGKGSRDCLPEGYEYCDVILDANVMCLELVLIDDLHVQFHEQGMEVQGKAKCEFGDGTITVFNNSIWKTDGEWLLVGPVPNSRRMGWQMLDGIIRPECLDYPWMPIMKFHVHGDYHISKGSVIGTVRLIAPHPDLSITGFSCQETHERERMVYNARQAGEKPTRHYRKRICSESRSRKSTTAR